MRLRLGAERARSDTLIKRGMHIDATLVRERTEHVTQAVQDDLNRNTRYANRNDFLDTFFRDETDSFHKVLDALKGLYDPTKSRWTALPVEHGGSEKNYYQPLQDLLNSMYTTYCTQKKLTPNRVWLDRHSTKPTSFTNAAENRPDLVNVYGLKDEAWEGHLNLLKEQDTKRITRSQTKAEASKEDISKELKDLIAYWCRVAVALEVKPAQFKSYSNEEVHKTILQLAGYLRQMLREQHDRHFVFGLILFHDKLSVWYCDRSGLLGMDDPINIHEEPELFVRVICSLSSLSPREMGWDPMMKLYRKDGQHVYTHELPFDKVVKEFKESAYLYRTQWAIEIKGKTYVTIKALSLARAEVMCGRAQLVWVAVDVELRKIVVIKQCWSPFFTKGSHMLRSEASIYGRVGTRQDNISQLVASDVVDGTKTVEDFRKRITSDPLPISMHGSTFTEKELGDQILHQQTTSMPDSLFENALPLTERQLCRLVFKDYGYPLKRFCSLKELLQTLLECLKGYEVLLQRGIVHRDISPGNLLICPQDYSPTSFDPRQCVGRINDLDHSKYDDSYKGRKIELVSVDAVFMKEQEELLQLILPRKFLKPPYRNSGISLHPDTCKTIVSIANDPRFFTKHAPRERDARADTYLQEAIFSFSAQQWKDIQEEVQTRTPKLIEMKDLRIPSIEGQIAPPDFKERISQNEERSGTLPFMSHRLLKSGIDDDPHTAIHDMESLLWVVMHIVWLRGGPGGDRRPDYSMEPPADTLTFRHLVYYFLDGSWDVLSTNKELLFIDPNDFATYLLPNIHPYFKKLEPMLKEWWRIVYFALQSKASWRGAEYLFPHVGFRRAVEECLNSLGQSNGNDEPSYRELEKKEIERRLKEHQEMDSWLNSICGHQQPPPLPVVDERTPSHDQSPPRSRPSGSDRYKPKTSARSESDDGSSRSKRIRQ